VEQDNSGKVYSMDVMKGRYAVFAFSEKGMMGEAGHVLIVDSKGREVADYRIDQDVVNIAANDDFIAITHPVCLFYRCCRETQGKLCFGLFDK